MRSTLKRRPVRPTPMKISCTQEHCGRNITVTARSSLLLLFMHAGPIISQNAISAITASAPMPCTTVCATGRSNGTACANACGSNGRSSETKRKPDHRFLSTLHHRTGPCWPAFDHSDRMIAHFHAQRLQDVSYRSSHDTCQDLYMMSTPAAFDDAIERCFFIPIFCRSFL